MKETINYYYNLSIDSIDELDGIYHFEYEKKDYYFVWFNRELDELEDIIECSKSMKEKGFEVHDIFLNIKGDVITKVGEFNYVLLSVNNKNKKYDIFDMLEMHKKLVLNNANSRLYRNNWMHLWSTKVDYFEYQIKELGFNKSAILKTFSYYIGLAENAISYANKTNSSLIRTSQDRIVLSHRRIFFPNIKLNYLNPLSFVFDLEVRDIAEYIKALFFSEYGDNAFDELTDYLKITKLSRYGYQMLYARLLYPSYYFDVYERIMNKEAKEDKLIEIVNKVDKYERFLKKTYLEISKYASIEKIDWIINQH